MMKMRGKMWNKSGRRELYVNGGTHSRPWPDQLGKEFIHLGAAD